ncbi:MAG: hypothetical protein ACUVQ1_03800 [Candidatus Kapaibacteriales bacterium]
MAHKHFGAVIIAIFISSLISYSELITNQNSANVELTDTTENDLEFDFDKQNDMNHIFPENSSFMEKFLWSENGFFRKIGTASALTPESQSFELSLRRTMLTIHQTSGMITWGLMTASAITSQLWLDCKISSPDLHRTFVYSSIGGYLLTG